MPNIFCRMSFKDKKKFVRVVESDDGVNIERFKVVSINYFYFSVDMFSESFLVSNRFKSDSRFFSMHH